jgi:hypothetical protein
MLLTHLSHRFSLCIVQFVSIPCIWSEPNGTDALDVRLATRWYEEVLREVDRMQNGRVQSIW